MKITEIFAKKQTTISFEIFPPKLESSYDSVAQAALTLGSYSPDFMSVTYGAGGGTSANTGKIAQHIQETTGIPSLAHLTCISSSREHISSVITDLQSKNIHNILALRGDIPTDPYFVSPNHFTHASDLIAEIKRLGNFCVGAACYPEGHPEENDRNKDVANLKLKIDAGCDFLTTQMFFDSDMMYSFLYRTQRCKIIIPIIAGIMPITSVTQIDKMITLSNARVPRKLEEIIKKYHDDSVSLKEAGIDFAIEQILDLLQNGIRGIHIYTMNKPDVAKKIIDGIRI